MNASVSNQIEGFTAPGFEELREAFTRNFAQEGERGAAFAAVHDGAVVADLWGGLAAGDGRRWQEDTIVQTFSGAKGLIALCFAKLIEQDRLDLDAPVADYWPEFAAAGKEGVLVRHVVSHQAGLPGVREPVDHEAFLDGRRMAELLAAQAPFHAPGTLCYHPVTSGWLSDELMRRIDGRTLRRFFAEEVAAPLGLELWLGLPAEQEPRVATLEYAANWGTTFAFDESTLTDPAFVATWANPMLLPPGELPWNRPDWHQAEIPSVNAIGSARAYARLYGCLARGGELDGVRVISEQALARARECLVRGREPFRGEAAAYGVGFALQAETMDYGPPATAFGHRGVGGSVHGAWPEERVGFSYAMNVLRDDSAPDPRPATLLAALHRCVAGRAG